MSKDRSPRRRPKAKRITDQHSGTPRNYWRLFLLAVSLPLVAVVTYAALRSPWLTVQDVRITGAPTLDSASLKELSGLTGRSMLDLPLEEARASLLAVPQVKSVDFSRDWLGRTVTLNVRERVPAAFWSVGGRDFVVDAEGYVLAAGAPSGPAPRIVEPDNNRVMGPGDRVHPDAIAFAQRIFEESPKFLNQSVKELEYRSGVGVTAVFSNGMRVTFGDDRAYDYKVAVLSRLLEQLSAKKQIPRAVDLRFGERVTYE